jgi:hypothetical protein
MSRNSIRQMPEKMPEEYTGILPSSSIEAPPGVYSIKLVFNDKELAATAKVMANPRY